MGSKAKVAVAVAATVLVVGASVGVSAVVASGSAGTTAGGSGPAAAPSTAASPTATASTSPADALPTTTELTPDELAQMDEGEMPASLVERSEIFTAFREDIDVWVNDGDVGHVADIDGQPSRFGSFWVDMAGLSADIYWAGEPPAELLDAVAAHPDVTVRFHTSPYSLHELIDARDRVAQADLTTDLRLFLVSPASDASGLKVEFSYDGEKPDAALVAQATRELEELTGVAVEVELVEGGALTF